MTSVRVSLLDVPLQVRYEAALALSKREPALRGQLLSIAVLPTGTATLRVDETEARAICGDSAISAKLRSPAQNRVSATSQTLPTDPSFTEQAA